VGEDGMNSEPDDVGDNVVCTSIYRLTAHARSVSLCGPGLLQNVAMDQAPANLYVTQLKNYK